MRVDLLSFADKIVPGGMAGDDEEGEDLEGEDLEEDDEDLDASLRSDDDEVSAFQPNTGGIHASRVHSRHSQDSKTALTQTSRNSTRPMRTKTKTWIPSRGRIRRSTAPLPFPT